MSTVKRGLAAVALAGAALLGVTAPIASAAGWVRVGDEAYSWGFCNWLGQQYADGSTGYECRYVESELGYHLYVGP